MEVCPENPSQIRGLFARVAWRYDLNNRLHSLGRDRAWRRAAAAAARIAPGQRVLDVACGTGGLTALLACAGGEVTGLDFCPEMLQIARQKYRGKDGDRTAARKDGDSAQRPEDGGPQPEGLEFASPGRSPGVRSSPSQSPEKATQDASENGLVSPLRGSSRHRDPSPGLRPGLMDGSPSGFGIEHGCPPNHLRHAGD